MPVLTNPRWEKFCQGAASGLSNSKAYEFAGFTGNRGNAYALRQRPEIEKRIHELTERKIALDEKANAQAIRRTSITKVRVAEELGKIAFANLADYTVVKDGKIETDLSQVSKDQMAAVQEITFETMSRGKGEVTVGKVRLKLGDKRGALMDLARLFGWIIEKQETGSAGAFDELSDSQLEERMIERMVDRGLDERRARAIVRARVIEGGSGDEEEPPRHRSVLGRGP